MGKVEAFTIEGLTIWFWSEDHRPPHFHVKKADAWEMKVNFLEDTKKAMFEIIWSNKPVSAKAKRELAKQVKAHRQELLKEWETKVKQP
jgi:hypothetical protein